MAADYYQVLGVDRDATGEEIKKAFRRIARETHPDANPGDSEAEARFKLAAEAYEVLSDPERRRRYDRGDVIDLGELFGGFGGLDDILQSVFGEGGLFGGGAQQNRPVRGRDVLVRLEVSLEEAAFGTDASVAFSTRDTCVACDGTGAEADDGQMTCPDCNGVGQVRAARRSLFGTMMTVTTCPTCRGEGIIIARPCPVCGGGGTTAGETHMTVEVPAGVSSGTRLRLSGRGESGGRQGPPGDLFVEVHVLPDARFQRRDDDLYHDIEVGIAQATLGSHVDVPLIDGGTTVLEIPAGTQPGSVLRVKGKGMTQLGRRQRGDLLVSVSVLVPTDVTPEQEELLQKLADLRDERTNRPASAG